MTLATQSPKMKLAGKSTDKSIQRGQIQSAGQKDFIRCPEKTKQSTGQKKK